MLVRAMLEEISSLPPCGVLQVQLNTGQLQYIRLAQPVSGTQVVQGQIQTLATNTQQVNHETSEEVHIY